MGDINIMEIANLYQLSSAIINLYIDIYAYCRWYTSQRYMYADYCIQE